MRRLLGAMRREGEEAELAPQPGLAGLDSLLDEFRPRRPAGRAARGGRAASAPPPLDLSAYRIVQEGLTNALKHARADHADVTFGYGPDELEIEVRDDGEGSAATAGLGHGLVGIRERVKIYGGEMSGRSANGAASCSARACRSTATDDDHPRPRRRRPVAGPRRLSHAARRTRRTSRSSPRRATGSKRWRRPPASIRTSC